MHHEDMIYIRRDRPGPNPPSTVKQILTLIRGRRSGRSDVRALKHKGLLQRKSRSPVYSLSSPRSRRFAPLCSGYPFAGG